MCRLIGAFLMLFFSITSVVGQLGQVAGTVKIEEEPGAFVQIIIDSTSYNTITDENGNFIIENIPFGKYQLTASFIGYKPVVKSIELSKKNPKLILEINIYDENLFIDNVVVTATKTSKRQTNSPVIVNVINSETIDNIQACNLSEGLKFQPGLRVETDCQTCNYTQLRMNGLAGGYSQILINGRPIFSPLTGLYGLEQLPANMIDRIEVVRGGGSSLYGSSAIGGTVNVMTKIPSSNSYEANILYQNIDGQTHDNTISGNATLVMDNKNSGISFFLNRRERGFYDANNDNFSEIPKIENTSIGTNFFILPASNQKLELNVSYIDEYRFGGEMVSDKPAYLAKQAEERTHNVWMGSADYQINFDNDNRSLITYLAWQNTQRNHYTGILPSSETEEYQHFVSNPPYGNSQVSTYNAGIQYNHRFENFLKGSNTFTIGTEYVYNDVLDEISAYEYLVDQTTTDLGVFLQSDYEIIPQLTLLSGVRMDYHNLLDKPIFSPRASLLYKYKKNTQFRFSYGTGFRAPQAFDTDLHIAFAGGGVSRVVLDPELIQERSQSFSTSINYDKPKDNWIGGFTLEGFYNKLEDVFYLQPIGEDEFGEVFEKQNGEGATVQGATVELRFNYDRKIQLESGFTLQTSKFESPVEYIEGVPGMRDFSRTPNDYGYAILTLSPNSKMKAIVNYLYTGSMQVPHFAGAPNQLFDEIITSDPFSELSTKLSYTLPIKSVGTNIELYGGVKNIFNAFQSDFDIGKNRDSNYVYGPSQPRTFYIGFKLKS